jgi:hypothetical protein
LLIIGCSPDLCQFRHGSLQVGGLAGVLANGVIKEIAAAVVCHCWSE